MSIELRDYQRACLDAICTEWTKGHNRLLVQLATGAGKTTIFSALPTHPPVAQWLSAFPPGQRAVLVVAHREELIDQSAERLRLMNPKAAVTIEQGERYASPYSDIVVASIQTLAAMKGRRLKRLLQRMRFRLVVIDEAHHASADSYRNMLVALRFLPPADASDTENDEAAFYSDIEQMAMALRGWETQAPKDQILIGVTATPNRSDAIGLGCVFQSIAYTYGIKPMIDDGWLVPIVPWVIETKTSLDQVRTTHGEFNQKDLAEAVNRDDRNQLAVAAWREHAKDLQTIAFTVDVAHAYAMATAFERQGIAAQAVSGDTPKEDRAAAFQRFRDGRIQVLSNCMIVTEGVDLPMASCILNAKPTKSATLYTQMVGRGLRPHHGKPHCVVIDLVDVARKHSLQAAPVLYGLPPGLKAQGEDLRKVEEGLEAFREQFQTFDIERALAAGGKTLAQLNAEATSFDVWAVPDLGAIASHVTLSWLKVGTDTYRLQYPWAGGTEVLKVEPDMLGHYVVSCTFRSMDAIGGSSKQRTLGAQIPSAPEALALAETFVANERRTVTRLTAKDARWKGDPATEKQIALLIRRRIPFQPGITKGAASSLLDLANARRGR